MYTKAMMKTTKKTCAIYVRVSTEEQADKGVSLDVQEDACREAAAELGFEVAEVFRDEGFSAFSNRPRPAYISMLERCSEFNSVFVLRGDRFGRRLLETHRAVGALHDQGVGYYSVTERYDPQTSSGWLGFTVASMMAESSSKITQERVLASIARIASKGQIISSPPFGYLLPGPKQPIVPHPVNAPILREIFERYAVDGATLTGICRWLDASNVPTAGGARHWYLPTIRRMLTCRTYLGKIVHERVGAEYQGLHEPLVDEELWRVCNKKINLNKRIKPRSRGKSLSPILFCGYCGCRLHLAVQGDGKHFYQCRDRLATAPELRHPPSTIQDWIVEGYIWALLDSWRVGSAADAYKRVISSATPSSSKVVGALRAEKESILEGMRVLARMTLKGTIDETILEEEAAPLRLQLKDVETKLRHLIEQEDTAFPVDFVGQAGKVRTGSFTRKLEFLFRVLKSVSVYHDHVQFSVAQAGVPDVKVARQYFKGRSPKEIKLNLIDT
ncbi:MAG: recombinase family protein [Armatimonadota bacterium]